MHHEAAYLNPPPGKASKFARAISNIINPVVSGLFVAGSTAYETIADPALALKWFVIMMFLTVIPPLSYIIYLVRIGYLVDIFMPDRRRRIKPIGVIVAWIIISDILLLLFGAPLPIILILIVTMALIGSLLAITFLWKISFHTAILTTAVTVTALQGAWHVWPTVLLIPLVGWSRVQLRRHTTGQVIVGTIAGCIVAIIGHSLILSYLGLN